jgi:hypothetical protein
MVVGLKGDQSGALEERLKRYPIAVRTVSPKRFLRLNTLNGHDLVVLTRFVKHKHSNHAVQIASGRVVWVQRGAASAVADTIIKYFGLERDAE